MRLHEDDADALKCVGVFTIYKILLIVHLLVWITNCTRCTVRTSKWLMTFGEISSIMIITRNTLCGKMKSFTKLQLVVHVIATVI
jgi:hypothetical protein